MSEKIIVNVPQINLNDYEITQYIGRGVFSVVCKAIDTKTKKEVAIKSYEVNEKRNLKNCIRNVNISCVDVPGIVKMLGYRFSLTEEEKKSFKYSKFTLPGCNKTINLTDFIVVTEYYNYNNVPELISEYLKSNGNNHDIINPTVRSKIIFGVASIMKQFHKKSIIHHDLKLENVFLSDQLEQVISNFDLSKFFNNQFELMPYRALYSIAPETLMDGEIYSFSVDVYGYAFLLYRMFASDIKFGDNRPIRSPQQFLSKIGRGMRPIKPENISDPYWELIQCCWKDDPDNRPTFDEITEILKSDKYAIEEFGMKTDIDDLRQYQNKIEGEKQ